MKMRYPKLTLAIFLVIGLIVYFLIRVDYNLKLAYNFNGVVTRVVYNRNNYPIVTVNGVDYELSFDSWDCNDNKIDIGDKMIKRKGDMTLLLVKANSRDTIDLLYKAPVDKPTHQNATPKEK
jgi:hypothetical protein